MRVLICDDHTLVRAGLRRLVESFAGIEVIAEAATVEEVLLLARRSHPDVVLLDLTLPGRSGFEALAELRQACPDTAVVIMSMHDDPTHVREALARGAAGFLVKEAAPAELEIALRAAVAGRTYLSPQVSAPQLGVARSQRNTGIDALPPRQREILAAIARGRTTKQIAGDLGISVKTVETHRARMMQTLGCRTTLDLLRLAVRQFPVS